MPTRRSTGPNHSFTTPILTEKKKCCLVPIGRLLTRERAVKEVDELEFRDDAKQLLMRDNALRVFKLPG